MILNISVTTILKEKLTPKVYRVRFAPEDGRRFEFEAGQFMSLMVAPNIRRSYSLSNPPYESDWLETLVDISPGGIGSKFFESLKLHDTVKVMVPLGRFVYKKDKVRPVHFYSTGTGISPFVSMIKQELCKEKSGRRVVLHQGFRYVSEIFILDEISKLKDEFPNFDYRFYVSRPETLWDGCVGRINSDIQNDLDELYSAEIYICGGTSMIKDTEQKLISLGISAEQIHYEKYY